MKVSPFFEMLVFASFLIDSTSLKSGITPWVDTFKICNVPGPPDDLWTRGSAEAQGKIRGRMAGQIDLRRPKSEK